MHDDPNHTSLNPNDCASAEAVDLAVAALLRPALEGIADAALVLTAIIDRMAGADEPRLAFFRLQHGRLVPDKARYRRLAPTSFEDICS